MKLSNLYQAIGYNKIRSRRKQAEQEEEEEDAVKDQIEDREAQIQSKLTVNMPSPSFRSNMDAPTPMRPNDRYLR